jgi:geranylgeranyl diphosphate synthase type II
LSENKKINLATLENIYYRKTAALICSSVRIGAILANAKKKELSLLTNYGKKLGLAFQIMDDILEATQNKKLKKSKPNYLSFFDIGSAKSMAEDKIKQAKAFLIDFGLKAKPLYSIADYIIQRKS